MEPFVLEFVLDMSIEITKSDLYSRIYSLKSTPWLRASDLINSQIAKDEHTEVHIKVCLPVSFEIHRQIELSVAAHLYQIHKSAIEFGFYQDD